MSLHQQLAELTTKLQSLVPADRLSTIDRAVEQLTRSEISKNVLKPADKAPDFELLDGDGMAWHSDDLLRRGPLIVVFYRGRWCAYCNTQLAALRQVHEQIAQAGAALVAISPQTQKHTYLTRDMHQLRFPVLSDPGNETTRKFGLVYRVPQELQRMYESIMTKLPGYNGDQTWELPLAATYIIAPQGIISFVQVNVDWRERPEPAELLLHLHP
ncbi:MAG TPA: peroxiredoxin-like family protein [Terriglobales bacterium]|nr:peroxiredoxin-like family protein [Terriglobales bacterium]